MARTIPAVDPELFELLACCLTWHAWQRMLARGFSQSLILLVLCYGRQVHTRGAVIHAVGRREVEQGARLGVDLRACEGVQVVQIEGQILTAYRNRDFSRLRTGTGHRRGAGRVA